MSVIDSDICWLSETLTVIAGKNESGKTALLRGLESIYNARSEEDIPDLVRRIDDNTAPLELTVWLKPSGAELDAICQEAGLTLPAQIRKEFLSDGIALVLTPNEYSLTAEDCARLAFLDADDNSTRIGKARTILESAREELNKFGISFANDIANDDLFEVIDSLISNWASKRQRLDAAGRTIQLAPEANLSALIDFQKENNERLSSVTRLAKSIHDRRPLVTYFDNFAAEIPFEISIEGAKEHPAIKDLAQLAGLDLDVLSATTDRQSRRNLLKRKSVQVSGDFGEFWTQNEIDLDFSSSDDTLMIGIADRGSSDTYRLEQRSRGFQWFIAFYSRLKTLSEGDKIVLIDEPGLFLHAKAQRDVLNVIEKFSPETQTIIATHSPYLIAADHIERVRLVVKEDRKTRIENKIHKTADLESLTPILTAIGLDLGQSLGIGRSENVIVEGPSEPFIFSSVLRLIGDGRLQSWALIPCMGATTIATIASLLHGWGYKYVCVFDNDAKGRAEQRRLSRDFPYGSVPVVLLPGENDTQVEDLFAQDDFFRVYLQAETPPKSVETNSAYIKQNRIDKVLTAKLFADRVSANKISREELSDETIGRFMRLFDSISKCLVDP